MFREIVLYLLITAVAKYTDFSGEMTFQTQVCGATTKYKLIKE